MHGSSAPVVEIDHHRRPTPTTRAVVLLVAMLVCWVVELNYMLKKIVLKVV